MRAITLTGIGGPEVLRLQEHPEPRPPAGAVLITTEAIGVGGVDLILRSGRIPGRTPAAGTIPGGEVAGIVTALGEGVDPALRGRRVWAATGTQGGYAEVVVAAAEAVTPLPDDMTSVDAVALGSAGPVAHFGLRSAHLVAGEAVLVRGATGSIGLAGIELARRAGASAILATTSSAQRAEWLRELGVTHVLDRAGRPLLDVPADEVASPDVILDVVAGPSTAAFVERLAPGGRAVIVGVVAGFPPPDVGQVLLSSFQRSLSLGTLSLDSVPRDALQRARADILRPVDQGGLPAVVDDVIDLGQAAEAHRRMESGDVVGRIVLVP